MRHAAANLFIRVEGDRIVVEPLHFTPPHWRNLSHGELIDFYFAQAIKAIDRGQFFAAAFHNERLHYLLPFNREVLSLLHDALKETPDSPARRALCRRLATFSSARLASTIGISPLAALPTLATTPAIGPPLASPP